jgi:hypothetical protein
MRVSVEIVRTKRGNLKIISNFGSVRKGCTVCGNEFEQMFNYLLKLPAENANQNGKISKSLFKEQQNLSPH